MRPAIVLVGIVTALLVGGAARLAHIHAVRGTELRAAATEQQTITRQIPAQRGEILDTRARVLAGTVRKPSLYVDPLLIDDARFAACSVAPIIDRDPDEFAARLTEWKAAGKRFVWLGRRVSEADAEAFRNVVKPRGLRAFVTMPEHERVYPQGPVAPQVLGFVGTDMQGLEGVEAAYDEILAGVDGSQEVTVDVLRRRVRSSITAYTPPQDGATIVLTIDAYVQQVAQHAIDVAVDEFAGEWGVCVVLDPQTGEVLALATSPGYDPADPVPDGYGRMSEAEQKAARALWRNRAVTDCYEPGSVFKPFIACSAVSDGLVNLDEPFVINGPVRNFGSRTLHDTHAYARLTLQHVIAKSSNIGMGLLAQRLGCERMHGYVTRLGFGAPTGIGLPGEHAGIVLNVASWNPGYSPQSVAMGHEIAVTPIQLASAFATFCNGGVLNQPRIVRGVIGSDGITVFDNSRPIVVRQVFPPDVVDEFRRRALAEVVRTGTGKPAALPNYQVFGKTGTAQVVRPAADGGGYEQGAYVGSFIGGAPLDEPRVVVLVSVYKPSTGKYYGSTVAAPAVRQVLKETLAYMQVPPEIVPEDE